MYKMMSLILLILLSISSLLITTTNALIVKHNFDSGMKAFSYQTFSGVAMYSPSDAPSKSSPGNGKSYVTFNLDFTRSSSLDAAFIEVILIPDINIADIGFTKNGNLHLCCNSDLFSNKINGCNEENIGRLLIPKRKDIPGLSTQIVKMEQSQSATHYTKQIPISATAIHVFALATCDPALDGVTVTFNGETEWMNPYGQLPGDVYGYLPFYGWMSIAYLCIAVLWFCYNFIYCKSLLHVQNCITGVLAMCLIEMAVWYFHYLHLNRVGVVHHGPFILGLITTCMRRMVSRMLVLAVSMGYGVVKPTLSNKSKNGIILLGITYFIFAFLFEALIHYNETQKVESWMRVILIPPVAIINGIFWWWTFVSLNQTIEQLKIRRQLVKLSLYKSFTTVLIIALCAAIAFAIYEMYYVLKELYFENWERLWFMEVGFWQILFSCIFVTIMVLWRPTQHFKEHAQFSQISNLDDGDDMLYDDDDNIEMQNQDIDSFLDHGVLKTNVNTKGGSDSDDNAGATAKFSIADGDDDDIDDDNERDRPKTTITDTLLDQEVNVKVD